MMRQFVLITLAMQFAIITAQSDLQIAGRVVVARGEAEVVHADGSRETLARRSEIRVGDTINTTANAWIQIRFIDSAILSLNCNSSLRINQYQYEDRNSDRADLYLQRGRIRTITGSIQRVNYQFVTDVANVYIGGTDFGIEAESAFSYVFGVYDGTIRVGNSYGQVLLGVGSDYIFARAEAGTSPIVLPYDPFSSPTLILGDTAC
jgi:hypothetical protein